jgi:hypothetical protein
MICVVLCCLVCIQDQNVCHQVIEIGFKDLVHLLQNAKTQRGVKNAFHAIWNLTLNGSYIFIHFYVLESVNRSGHYI